MDTLILVGLCLLSVAIFLGGLLVGWRLRSEWEVEVHAEPGLRSALRRGPGSPRPTVLDDAYEADLEERQHMEVDQR